MRHMRTDYDAIQPFPTKRPHHVKIEGETRMDVKGDPATLGHLMEPIIPDDEPVFLLRAKDAVAPAIVRHWAKHRRIKRENEIKKFVDFDEVEEAVLAWADEMERYAAEHYDGGKLPDTPDELLKDV